MFGKKPSLEQQLANLTVACREALNIPEGTDVTGESIAGGVTNLRTAVTEAQSALAGLQTLVCAALNLGTEAEITAAAIAGVLSSAKTEGATEAQSALDGLSSLVRTQLEMDDKAGLTAETIAPAVTALVNAKAAAIAAGQHVPPVQTSPDASLSDEDPVKAAYAAAAQETDPSRRSLKFAAARELLEKRAGKKISGLN